MLPPQWAAAAAAAWAAWAAWTSESSYQLTHPTFSRRSRTGGRSNRAALSFWWSRNCPDAGRIVRSEETPMRHLFLLAALLITPALAQDQPEYLDDRSTAE